MCAQESEDHRKCPPSLPEVFPPFLLRLFEGNSGPLSVFNSEIVGIRSLCAKDRSVIASTYSWNATTTPDDVLNSEKSFARISILLRVCSTLRSVIEILANDFSE